LVFRDGFIRNNRGINDGKDLPKEYLENLYDEIKTRQIQVIVLFVFTLNI
jgi:brefeldin A-inhibited guanine nucleotide-exchange protein